MHAALEHPKHNAAQPQRHNCLRALVCVGAAFVSLQLGGCAVVNEGASAPTSHARVVQRDLGGAERTTRSTP